MNEEIQQARVDLAAALRLAVRFGLHEGICNHFSFALPGLDDRFLLNPHGIHWSQLKASNMLLVDGAGKVLEGGGEAEISAFSIHESVVAFHDKAAEITEEYRSLRARLTALNTAGENQVIAITSSIPKEGKSVTTMNLAWVISEIKHFRVLMIDGDFRRSSLASMMGISEYPGLADLLRGEARLEEVIRPTPVPNLHVIPAGTTQEFNAAELLSTQRTASILQECKRRYQYSLIDTPPASTVSDASVLGPLCTGVLFIVRMGRTPEPISKSTIRLLQSNNVNILGCVLAGHRESAGRYRRYYYGYHKYYSDPY